jgi:alpha-tubulin suppressor-like RCC1 family protein
VDLPAPAAAVSARFSHSCALLKNATLYCWGQNAEGQLGQDDPGVSPDDPTQADGLLPVSVGGAEWIDVATGDGHTCAVRLDGALFCWGRNSSHQLGPDSRIQIRAPIQVDTALDWLDVDAGQQHTFAVKRDGTVYAWGENVARASDEGFPLGIDVDELDEPTLVELERGGTAVVSTSVFHTCSVSDGGELDCWGRNAEGQLGTGDIELRREPTPIATGIATVSTSWFTTCVINVEGAVLCTGKNGQGELGLGHLERPLVLSEVVLEAP